MEGEPRPSHTVTSGPLWRKLWIFPSLGFLSRDMEININTSQNINVLVPGKCPERHLTEYSGMEAVLKNFF